MSVLHSSGYADALRLLYRPTQRTAGGNALAEAISHAFISYSCAIFQQFVKTIVHTDADTMFFSHPQTVIHVRDAVMWCKH